MPERVPGWLRKKCSSLLAQNVISNYAGVAWMGVLALALIPVFLRKLGPAQWGLVAAGMAMQGLWGVLDAGLSQIMPRDIARAAIDKRAKIYKAYLYAFGLVAVAGFLVGESCAPWLVHRWLKVESGDEQAAILALRIVMVQFLFQFSNGANTGYWYGSERQSLAILRQVLFGTSKYAASLLLVSAWAANATSYLVPFAVLAAVECLANMRKIGVETGAFGFTVVPADLLKIAREAGVLIAGVLVGILVSQVDRIVLSHSVSMADFGRYSIAASLGLAFLQLQYPLMRAFLPRQASTQGAVLGAHNRKLLLLVVILCVLPCLLVIFFARPIVSLWLRNPGTAFEVVFPLRLILLAVALNAVYGVLYQGMLVRGEGRAIVFINTAALVGAYACCQLLVPSMGIAAGGAGWVAASMCQLAAGMAWMVMRRPSAR